MGLALELVRGMQRRVREALRDPPPWAVPDVRKLSAPSDAVVRETLRLLWERRRWSHERPWYPWGNVPPPAQRGFAALGVPLSVRLEPG